MLNHQELLRAVRRIEVQADRLANDLFVGGYHSAFKGLGLEFHEVREYVPGDDVRHMDWNITARTGRAHVKRFVEERELTLLLLVDVSASLDFGTGARTKAQTVAEACALLALTALKNNDKVALVTFSDEVELHLPARKGRRHVLRLVRELLDTERHGQGTNLAGALEYATRCVSRRAILFVLSDFRCGGYLEALAAAHRRHDVVAVEVGDPAEGEWAGVGLLELEDAERGSRRVLDTSAPALRQRASRLHQEDREQRRRLFESRGVDWVKLETNGSSVDPLVEFFARRSRRAGR